MLQTHCLKIIQAIGAAPVVSVPLDVREYNKKSTQTAWNEPETQIRFIPNAV
jgi:hypothetical protein